MKHHSFQTKLWQLHIPNNTITFLSPVVDITWFLWQHFPFSPQDLCQILVNRISLGCVCLLHLVAFLVYTSVNQDDEYVLFLIALFYLAMLMKQGWSHQSKESSGWKHLWHNQPEGDPTETWTVVHTRIHIQTPASPVSETGFLKPNSATA